MTTYKDFQGIKSGKLCECGCGEETNIAYHTNTTKGWIKGQPLRFVRNHHVRRETKWCKGCKQDKPWPSGFYRRSKNCSGYQRLCTECSSLRRSLHKEGGDLTVAQWKFLIEWFKVCVYCGSDDSISKDRVIPHSMGGIYTMTNVVPACRQCNDVRRDVPIEQWSSKADIILMELSLAVIAFQ